MGTELILMRHGKTQANINGTYCGKTDLSLAGQGIKEIRKTACNVPPFDHVYASTATRARQTAGLVASHARVEYLSALQEIDFGDFDGMTAAQIEKRMPEIWQEYLKDPIHFTFPNGDNVEEYMMKAARTAEDIVKAHPDKRILVVTHKGFIMAALSYYLHGDVFHMFHYDVRPSGFAKLMISGDFGILKQMI